MRTHWHDRWDEGRIGFHQARVNGVLRQYQERLTPGRILVPLCGKTVDLWHLAEAGFEVVGVELVPRAVEQLFAERGVEPEVDGALRRGGGIEVFVGDFFAFDQTGFDSVWDRAALIALPEVDRARYAQHLLARMRSGGRMLLATLDYDQRLIDGPPWAVSDAEVSAHFAGAGKLEALATSAAEVPPRMTEAGVEATQSVWLLTRA